MKSPPAVMPYSRETLCICKADIHLSSNTWHLPVVKISPEWVTGPEQGKSSGRIATFSFWTGMFWDGISSIHETNTQIVKELKITQIWDKLQEYKRNWMHHVNRMPRNRIPRVMKQCFTTGRRNHVRPLKRLLDAWDRNGSTSGRTPWKIDDDDDDDDDNHDDLLAVLSNSEFKLLFKIVAGSSRVRSPMVSLEFFTDIILRAALCPWSVLSN